MRSATASSSRERPSPYTAGSAGTTESGIEREKYRGAGSGQGNQSNATGSRSITSRTGPGTGAWAAT
jgi:hypothetical protein